AVGTNPVTAITLPVGVHSIALQVSDGLKSATNMLDVEIITPATAVRGVITAINATELGSKHGRPLLASLDAAATSFDRDNFNAGLNELAAFQNKVHAQMARSEPALAEQLTAAAQQIVDAVGGH